MSEQRREAHRGLAGLNQTWVAAIARARSRVRYMALCRRLLDVGMRPPGASAPPSAEPRRTSSSRTDGEHHPEMARRRTEPAAVMNPPSTTRLRKTFSTMSPNSDPSSPLLPDGASLATPAVVDGNTERSGGRPQRSVSGGAKSAELRRLAHQIRCGGSRRAPVGRFHSPEDRKALEVLAWGECRERIQYACFVHGACCYWWWSCTMVLRCQSCTWLPALLSGKASMSVGN